MIVVSGIIVINPDRVTVALDRVKKMMAATQAEPGNVSYEYWAALEEPGRYHIFEEWESRAALDAHNLTTHAAEFMGGLGDFEISHIEINEYEVTQKTQSL